MRSPTEIKRLEKEALADYIRKLYISLSKEPMTPFEFELERTIWRDIKDAKKEYSLM